tara:strand:- start:4909 stop:5286 length:378 start_codon:yes stop_codon:yes gene_type:complete
MMVSIEVSVGELFDKITILKIKQKKLTDKEQLENVNKELAYLESKAFNNDPEVNALVAELESINEQLWDIENSKRKCEADKMFGAKFVRLARDVYIKNDDRAKIKKMINVITNSDVVEEKDYTKY